MMIEILARTPIWVWGILLALIAFGASMMQTRTLSIRRLTWVPVAMIIYSFTSSLFSFGAKPAYSLAWLIGLVVVALIGQDFMRPTRIQYLADRNSFIVSGSVIPLMLMLSIFCLKFAVAVLNLGAPALISDPIIASSLCGLLGMKSGAFLARSLAIRAEKSRPQLLAADRLAAG